MSDENPKVHGVDPVRGGLWIVGVGALGILMLADALVLHHVPTYRGLVRLLYGIDPLLLRVVEVLLGSLILWGTVRFVRRWSVGSLGYLIDDAGIEDRFAHPREQARQREAARWSRFRRVRTKSWPVKYALEFEPLDGDKPYVLDVSPVVDPDDVYFDVRLRLAQLGKREVEEVADRS